MRVEPEPDACAGADGRSEWEDRPSPAAQMLLRLDVLHEAASGKDGRSFVHRHAKLTPGVSTSPPSSPRSGTSKRPPNEVRAFIRVLPATN